MNTRPLWHLDDPRPDPTARFARLVLEADHAIGWGLWSSHPKPARPAYFIAAEVAA